MKDINISSVPAYPEERDYLKLVIPNLSGAFGLLEERDLTKLLQLKDRKELRMKQRLSTSTPAKAALTVQFTVELYPTLLSSSLDAKSVSLVAEYSDGTSEDECTTTEPPLKKCKFPSFTGNNFTIRLIITIYWEVHSAQFL